MSRQGDVSIDLGLALVSLVAIPGVPLTTQDISAWCGCSRQRIDQIEKQGLRKIRNHLMFRDPGLWAELRMHLSSEQQPAKAKFTKPYEIN